MPARAHAPVLVRRPALVRGPVLACGLALAALAACSPQAMVQKVNSRAAESVVRPIVSKGLTGAQADIATQCVISNATPDELSALAKDIGVYAGSLTEDRVLTIIKRPATTACIASARGAA